MEQTSKTSPAQRAFLHYLRTGQHVPEEHFQDDAEVELKFNPYHDPNNGQFTFAPGGPRSSSGVIVSASRRTATSRSTIAPKAVRQVATVPSRPYLSARHNELLQSAARYPADRGTVERWSGSDDKEKFKAQWVHGRRNAILAAAKAKDIPPALLGSIAYREVGSDGITDDIAHMVRSESGRSLLVTGKVGKLLNPPADQTSFGPLNIQERRAAQILGYGDISTMTETARRTLAPTTKDPTAAIFMAAQHLSDLRDQDFRGVAGKDLTKDQLLVIATRYNRGPEKSLEDIKSPKNIESGNRYIRVWSLVSKLLK